MTYIMMNGIMKKAIGIFGIFIMIAGWILSNTERYDFIYKLFAADHIKAKTASCPGIHAKTD